MRKNIYMLIAVVVAALVLATGCNMDARNAEIAEELAVKAEALQPLLPVLTAAQDLYVPEDASTAGISLRTLNPSNTTGTDADEWNTRSPSTVYADTEFFNVTTEIATIGSEANPMEDLNGNIGDDYYFTLSLFGANPDAVTTGDDNLYKVSLYTYPTTSPSVHYVLEEYLVSDTTAWSIVDTTGVYNPLFFLRYETHYYDGSIDYRTFVWSSNVSTNYYVSTDLYDETSDDDPEAATASARFTFPADPAVALQPTSGTGDFSILVSGTLPARNINFYEYYGEYSSSDDRRSAAFLSSDLSAFSIDGLEETVRRSQYLVSDGTKTVRAKTVNNMTVSGTSVEKVIYETIDIDFTAGTYDSTVKIVKDGTAVSTTVTDLGPDTTATAGSYSGTVTVTIGTTETAYTATLTAADGLTLTTADGDPVIDGYTPVALEEGQQLLVVELTDGTTIEGILTSGKINGIIRSGRAADIIIGPTYVQVIYNQNKHSR